jgi:hypothetical protein
MLPSLEGHHTELLDSSLLDFSSLPDSVVSLDEETSDTLETTVSELLDDESLETQESTASELLDNDSSAAHDSITSTPLELDNSLKSPALEPSSPPQATSITIVAKQSPWHSFRIFTPFLRKP